MNGEPSASDTGKVVAEQIPPPTDTENELVHIKMLVQYKVMIGLGLLPVGFNPDSLERQNLRPNEDIPDDKILEAFIQWKKFADSFNSLYHDKIVTLDPQKLSDNELDFIANKIVVEFKNDPQNGWS